MAMILMRKNPCQMTVTFDCVSLSLMSFTLEMLMLLYRDED